MARTSTRTLDELWERIESQERHIHRLEIHVQQLQEDKAALAGEVQMLREGTAGKRRLSRAGLIKAAAIGAIGLAGVEALRPQAAFAGTDGDIGIGVYNSTGDPSAMNATTVLLGESGMTTMPLPATRL